MKLGILISVVILASVGAFVFFSTGGVADLPTSATSTAKLERVVRPAALVPLYTSDEPDEDADARYRDLLAFYRENKQALDRPAPPDNLIHELQIRLDDARRAGQVPDGFLDDEIPVEPVGQPHYEAALETISRLVLERAGRRLEAGEERDAQQAAEAVGALGERLYEKSARLWNRWHGVGMLKGALNILSDLAEHQPDLSPKVEAWVAHLRAVDAAWEGKTLLLRSLRPHIGDLLNLAKNERDPTFRIEAVLNLGLVKFKPGHRGNARAIQAAIEAAKADADPRIAAAGRAADAYTLEQLRKLS